VPKIKVESKGRFAAALKGAVEKSGMSLADLAQKLDLSYEHVRKLVAGLAYPSMSLLQILASTLGADRDKLEQLIETDKFHRDYKYLPKSMKQSPELEPFEPIIPKLSPVGREMLLQMAKTLLRQEKAPRK
jgi:transcriptional regulator with XRE-family HTH domain